MTSGPGTDDRMPLAEFAFPGPLRDQLVAAILTGAKTSTTGLLLAGEGHRTVAQWRVDHEAFWHSAEHRAALGGLDVVVDDDTPVVLSRFRLLRLV